MKKTTTRNLAAVYVFVGIRNNMLIPYSYSGLAINQQEAERCFRAAGWPLRQHSLPRLYVETVRVPHECHHYYVNRQELWVLGGVLFMN